MGLVEGELADFGGECTIGNGIHLIDRIAIWAAVTFWHALSLGFLYLIGGLIAAIVFRRRTRVALGVLILSTLFGLLAGAIEGALYGNREEY